MIVLYMRGVYIPFPVGILYIYGYSHIWKVLILIWVK